MIRWLLIAALLQMPMGGITGVASGGGPAAAYVQSAAYDCPNDGSTCTIGSGQGLATVGTGHLFIIWCFSYGGNCSTATAPVATPATTLTQLTTGLSGSFTAWYTCNSNAITSISYGAYKKVIQVMEFSGVPTSACSDISTAAKGVGGSTAWSSNATGTLAQAKEVVVALVGSTGTGYTPACTAPTGIALMQDTNGTSSGYTALSCYSIVNSTSSVTPAGTVSPAWSSTYAYAITYTFRSN